MGKAISNQKSPELPTPNEPWEERASFFPYMREATDIRMVGLTHQFWRSERSRLRRAARGGQIEGHRPLDQLPAHEESVAWKQRVRAEVDAENGDEPVSPQLRHLQIFFGSPQALSRWQASAEWHPEAHSAVRAFWLSYREKLGRIRPGCAVELFEIDDVSPLCLHWKLPNGVEMVKWTPIYYDRYLQGMPGYLLSWSPGQPKPTQFDNIVAALDQLARRATRL